MADKKVRGHDANRKLICACCGIKNMKCLPVGPALEKVIQDEICKYYSISESRFPSGVCPYCKNQLQLAKKKGKMAVSEQVKARSS